MRERIALAVALLTLALPLAPAPAQRPGGLSAATVIIVSSAASEGAREASTAFRRRLEQRGVRVSAELSLGTTDSSRVMAALRAARPDLVLAVGTRAQDLARRVAPQSALVAAMVSHPQEPGTARGTGVALDFSYEQQLLWIRRILPASQRRIGIVHSASGTETLAAVRELARAHGMVIVSRLVQQPAEIPQALSSLAGSADVLWGLRDPMVMTPETARSILLFSLRSRMPMIGLSTAWVKSGALFALDRDYADIGVQCAEQAIRLLSGDAMSSVPAERPRRLVYVVNQRTADLMSVKFSAETLRNASEVVR